MMRIALSAPPEGTEVMSKIHRSRPLNVVCGVTLRGERHPVGVPDDVHETQ